MHLIVLTYTTCCLDVHAQVIVPSRELASKHYAEHDGKPFFPKLVGFLSSGVSVSTGPSSTPTASSDSTPPTPLLSSLPSLPGLTAMFPLLAVFTPAG